MFRWFSVLAMLCIGMAWGTASAADPAFTTANVNLRAGPSVKFPTITMIPDGSPVMLHGCLESYTWCDVSWHGERGWMAASYVQVHYRGRPVVITPDIGPSLRVVVVPFDRGYWDDYYHDRPWYHEWPRYYTLLPPPPRHHPHPAPYDPPGPGPHHDPHRGGPDDWPPRP